MNPKKLDKKKIEDAVIATDGNIKAAAELLGVSRQTMYVEMRRQGMDAGLLRKRSAKRAEKKLDAALDAGDVLGAIGMVMTRAQTTGAVSADDAGRIVQLLNERYGRGGRPELLSTRLVGRAIGAGPSDSPPPPESKPTDAKPTDAKPAGRKKKVRS